MPALADDDGAVIAGKLAFAACALEVDAADTACVVGFFGEIPFPGCYGSEGVDGDFHGGWCVGVCGMREDGVFGEIYFCHPFDWPIACFYLI